jgi:hypothetical protein
MDHGFPAIDIVIGVVVVTAVVMEIAMVIAKGDRGPWVKLSASGEGG